MHTHTHFNYEVYEFSIGLGNVMGRENVSDIKSSKKTGIEGKSVAHDRIIVGMVQSYLHLQCSW